MKTGKFKPPAWKTFFDPDWMHKMPKNFINLRNSKVESTFNAYKVGSE